MSIKQSTVLNGLIIALVFVSGCGGRPKGLADVGPGKKHGTENNRSFRIYIYTDPTDPQAGCLVDWPQATLWKSLSHNQTATWVSDDGAAYTVDFSLGTHQSPFSTGVFPVPAGGEVHSGPLTGALGYYDYGIKGANNKTCKPATDPDPGVYVK
jgi:hypothetical protein